jgi:hypothetical protein
MLIELLRKSLLLKLVANTTISYTIRYNSTRIPIIKAVSAVQSLTTLKDLKIVFQHD